MEVPRTLEELKAQINAAEWFTRVGQHPESDTLTVLRSLTPEPGVVDEWDWLPTSHTEPDPIHGDRLKELAGERGLSAEYLQVVTEVYKLALVSLRRADEDDPRFEVARWNLFPAGRNAALFAVRRAAAEIFLEEPGFWCSLIPLYAAGYWPCGYADGGRVAVFKGCGEEIAQF